MTAAHSVTRFLWRAYVRDRYKVPPEIQGWRSTREVAEHFRWSMATARRRLEAAYQDDLIECSGPAPYEWYVRPSAGNDDDGEPIPIPLAV